LHDIPLFHKFFVVFKFVRNLLSSLVFEFLDASVLLGDLGLEVSDPLLLLVVLGLELDLRQLLGLDGDGLVVGFFLLDRDVSGRELDELGLGVLAAEPFGRGERGFAREGRGIEIILEDIGLARHVEGDGLDGGGGDLEETGNFAGGGVEVGLGDPSHTTLRSGRLVLGQAVNIGGVNDR